MVMEPISERAAEVANQLLWTVLPSANLVVTVRGLSEDRVKRGLRELRRREVLKIHELGCLLPPAPVAVWAEWALGHFNASEWERSWLGTDGLGNLALHDVAKVEAVNAVAPLYANGGWVLSWIHFFERQPMIAAAEYHHPDHRPPAYLVFCWVSMLENQREAFERIEALEDAMQAVSVDPDNVFWPAGIALLAASEWGAAQALCLARTALDGWVEPGRVAGWYYGSGGWRLSNAASALTGEPPAGVPPLLDPVRTLRPSISNRKLGRGKLENILTGSLWSGRGGHKLVELLTLVASFPCGSVAHYQRLVGEKFSGTDTRKRLKCLEKMGLIEIVTKHGRAKRRRRWPRDVPVTLSGSHHGAHRYAATLAGRVQFCYVHGGRPQDLFLRTKLGRRKTEVRAKVLLHLLTLSWMVHLLHAPWVRALGLSDLIELARNWRRNPPGRPAPSPHAVLHGPRPRSRSNADGRPGPCPPGPHLDATPREHGRGPLALPARGHCVRDPRPAPRAGLRLCSRLAGLDHPGGRKAHRAGRRGSRRDSLGQVVVLPGGGTFRPDLRGRTAAVPKVRIAATLGQSTRFGCLPR